MAMPIYEAQAFLQDGSDFEIGAAIQRLTSRLPDLTVTRTGEKGIRVSAGSWTMRVELQDEAYVAEDARELAEELTECPRAAEIAACNRRVEIWSRDPDPEMDHFNDYVLSCETIEGFRGTILFDPQAGELI